MTVINHLFDIFELSILGIIPTDYRKNQLYLIKYLDIFIWVKNASGKCSELFPPKKPQNRPQMDFQGRVFYALLGFRASYQPFNRFLT